MNEDHLCKKIFPAKPMGRQRPRGRAPLRGIDCVEKDQGRSYRRISHINDTGLPSYRGPNMCSYSPTDRILISKKGP
ncbi:hypothetical protein TNCV_665591 [Trichonephila clavipes]|uniref:Uncharacterized protein n=1 Tax=Trichonephila clavipes TaxID=2585209 RepID=A0A8X6SU37_TRICX|nr:hypothetical protein TNCV_665591 [Trichonephila clavipes]